MWFDPLTAWVVSLFTTGIPIAKEKIGVSLQKEIPAENWANKELYYKDMMDGVSVEQRMKNVANGKYKLTGRSVVKHPEPHRDPETGKIIIENCKLYQEDRMNYGNVQAQKWVREGKYNLDGEALRKEQERIKKKYEQM